MAVISQIFSFTTAYRGGSGVGASYRQGVGIDPNLRGQAGVLYFTGWNLLGQTLTLELSGDVRPSDIGSLRFSDEFSANGYIVLRQGERRSVISASLPQSYAARSLAIDFSTASNALEIRDFANRFVAGDSSSLELRDGPLPVVYDPLVGWAAEIRGIGRSKTPLRLWSGEGELRLDSKVYQGTTHAGAAMISVEQSPVSAGDPTNRAKVNIAVPSSAVREMLNVDVGPVWIEAFNIISHNNGQSWTRVPSGIAGRLSRPSFDVEGSIYSVEVETYSGDADRGVPRMWSHESHNAEYPADQGMEFMRLYEAGVEIKWPP